MTSVALTTAEANKDLITQTLRELNLITTPDTGLYNRAKVNGITIELGDDVFTSNQKTKEPAFFARLVDVPLEYNGMWLTADDAQRLGRPDAADSYCKSYAHIPEQARKFAEDGTSCEHCAARPWIKKEASPLENYKRCGSRADLLFQHCTELGETLDDTIWTLSLSVTGVIDIYGTRNNPDKGYVSDQPFMHRLAAFAISSFDKLDPKAAIAQGGIALRTGRVIVGIRSQQVKSQDNSRSFAVVVLEPRNIILEEFAESNGIAIAASVAPEATNPDDDLPF